LNPRTIPVIVNVSSAGGRAGDGREALVRLFENAGLDARIIAVEPGTSIGAIAREALRAHPPVIVAAGGDGTHSAVAHELRGTDTALGIIPLGTANHFPRDLGIPADLAGAVRAIAQGHRITIDVGEVNGITFVNNSSLGLYPGIVRRRERQQRRLRRSKRAAMTWAILAALRHSPLLSLTFRIDDREGRLRSPFVFIGNNEYTMEGFDIGRRAKLDAGVLSVYTTARSTAAGLFALALRALFGCLRQARDFAAARVRTLQIEAPHRAILVATDGELRRMEPPLEYRIVRGALHVIVPQPAP
jgi:diacylglycerol kinase family enzyme